mmetsp:Transcript_73303/g.215038  ORF Transcript_73303/g.215038 Transcript_73303/m.215038 type:complete len:278 (-) Transcript_73303:65-898(-)
MRGESLTKVAVAFSCCFMDQSFWCMIKRPSRYSSSCSRCFLLTTSVTLLSTEALLLSEFSRDSMTFDCSALLPLSAFILDMADIDSAIMSSMDDHTLLSCLESSVLSAPSANFSASTCGPAPAWAKRDRTFWIDFRPSCSFSICSMSETFALAVAFALTVALAVAFWKSAPTLLAFAAAGAASNASKISFAVFSYLCGALGGAGGAAWVFASTTPWKASSSSTSASLAALSLCILSTAELSIAESMTGASFGARRRPAEATRRPERTAALSFTMVGC